MMPDIGGLEILRRVKETHPAIGIARGFIASGISRTRSMCRSRRLGEAGRERSVHPKDDGIRYEDHVPEVEPKIFDAFSADHRCGTMSGRIHDGPLNFQFHNYRRTALNVAMGRFRRGVGGRPR